MYRSERLVEQLTFVDVVWLFLFINGAVIQWMLWFEKNCKDIICHMSEKHQYILIPLDLISTSLNVQKLL